MRACHLFLVTATLCSATPRATVAQRVQPTSGDTLLVREVFPGPGPDTVLITLRFHGEYSILVSPASARLSLHPIGKGRAAFVALVSTGAVDGSARFEVHPYVSGPHYLVVSPTVPTDTVEFSVWGNPLLEAANKAERERLWGIGVLVAAGYLSGYATQGSDRFPATGSADIEGGLLVGSSARLSGLLGAGYQARYSGSQPIVWVFIEPRVAVIETALAHHQFVTGIGLRLGQGNSARTAVDPSLLAPALYTTYALDSRPGARGWRIGGQLLYGRLGDLPTHRDRTFMRAAVSLSWLP
ncbi:MAG TPA: hypothetical protein VH879_05615 [Gemmatimonadales bacterium]|jgi:hypothetical protein